MIDLIFPNREQPPQASLGRDRAGAHHRRGGKVRKIFGRRGGKQPPASPEGWSGEGRGGASTARDRKARAAITGRPMRRRRVLLGIGTGAVVAGGAGTAAAMLTGALTSSPSSRRPNTSDGLGAAGLADSPSEAARIAGSATPTWPTPLGRDSTLHLLRRATFGPTLIDVVAVNQLGVDAWLERQLSPATIADPIGDQVRKLYPTIVMNTAQIRKAVKPNDYLAMWELGQGTLGRQLWSSRQLFEVMVDFWSNHLNVTNPFDGGWDVRTSFDNEVIRKHAFGRFSDMLHASARHPAMMRYLDNARSTKQSVNENYGRELLELHTVGIEAKYSERDVRHSAYLMTGRTVDDEGRFEYDKYRHWTGKVQVLSFKHNNVGQGDGLKVGDQYLVYLATHPATAHRIATKLARRFVCDDPPKTLVDRLAQSYLDNGTAIVPVLRTLFSSIEFWISTGLKTRRPLENVVATARILGVSPGKKTRDGLEGLYWMTNQLGMAPLSWGPPDGFPDVADGWGSAHATLGTWNAHRALIQGWHEGLGYPPPETYVGLKPTTYGRYLDNVALRLVHQKMSTPHKQAVLKFLGVKDNTKVKDVRLGGLIDNVIPLILDSVYHALR